MARPFANPTNKQRFEYYHGSTMSWEEFKGLVSRFTYYGELAKTLGINPKNCVKWQRKAREELGMQTVRAKK
jgi:hypothetical protein